MGQRAKGIDILIVDLVGESLHQRITPHAAGGRFDQIATIGDQRGVAVDGVAAPGDELGQRPFAQHQQHIADLQVAYCHSLSAGCTDGFDHARACAFA